MKIFTTQEKGILKFLAGSLLFGSLYTVYKKWNESNLITSDIKLESFIAAASEPWDEEHIKDYEKKQIQSLISININSANKAELMTLPEIGPVTAERIIRSRENYGSFKNITDINRVKGIGRKTFAGIEPFITIEEK